jgi:hypothetical protein
MKDPRRDEGALTRRGQPPDTKYDQEKPRLARGAFLIFLDFSSGRGENPPDKTSPRDACPSESAGPASLPRSGAARSALTSCSLIDLGQHTLTLPVLSDEDGHWDGGEVEMKDPYEVLKQKEADMRRIQKEIETLNFVIPLLAEDADRIEDGLAPPRLRATGTAGARPPQASRSTQI